MNISHRGAQGISPIGVSIHVASCSTHVASCSIAQPGALRWSNVYHKNYFGKKLDRSSQRNFHRTVYSPQHPTVQRSKSYCPSLFYELSTATPLWELIRRILWEIFHGHPYGGYSMGTPMGCVTCKPYGEVRGGVQNSRAPPPPSFASVLMWPAGFTNDF